jgi:tungstate transport system ATP-binding protein
VKRDWEAMPHDLIRIEGLRKSFGDRSVLNIESFGISTGKCYALTGDNGAGKSTLMRVLAGLEPATVKKFSFDGAELEFAQYPIWLRRRIMYIHQHPYLFDSTVAKNIAYGLKQSGVARSEQKRLVNEAIEWAGMAHLADARAQKLSGGEKQKIALVRAMVLKPKLFLMDEPLANLDTQARQQTIALIERLCSTEHTVLIACHDGEISKLPGVIRLNLVDGEVKFPETSLRTA